MIRLRHPWHWSSLADEPGDNPREATGGYRAMRHFHRPTGLDSDTHVLLALENLDDLGGVELNGKLLERPLRHGNNCRYAVHGELQPRNQLVLHFPADRRSLPIDQLQQQLDDGRVRLEIYDEPLAID